MNRRIGRPRALQDAPTVKPWYRIENFVEQPDTAAIYIYAEIGYWGVTADDFVRDLVAIKASTIDLHINSPGGEVDDGIAIYNALRNHRASVTTHIDGLAASSASFIAMAGDRVLISRNSQLMIHDALSICFGNAEDMQRAIDLLNRYSDNIADIYAQKAGGTAADWRERMRAETWYTGAEAVDAGLADELDGTASEGDQASIAASTAPDHQSLVRALFKFANRDEAPAPVPRAKAPEPEPPPETAPEVPVFTFDPEKFRNALKEAAL